MVRAVPKTKKLNIVKLNEKDFENETIHTLKVSRNNNRAFHINELHKIINSAEKKYSNDGEKDVELLVRGSNALNEKHFIMN